MCAALLLTADTRTPLGAPPSHSDMVDLMALAIIAVFVH